MVFSYLTRFFNYQSYLERYGYLSPTDVKFGQVKSKWKLYQAVRNLQRFTGLNETGNPEDPNTIELVTRHRCGFRDLGKTAQFRRKRRYSLHGTFWHKNVSFFLSRMTNLIQAGEIEMTEIRTFLHLISNNISARFVFLIAVPASAPTRHAA